VAPVPDFTFDLLAYGVLVLGGFGLFWLYYDQRDRLFYDSERRKITVHCIRCDHLYTPKTGTDLAQCPRCNHRNTRLKF
jgi:hypothetical protein